MATETYKGHALTKTLAGWDVANTSGEVLARAFASRDKARGYVTHTIRANVDLTDRLLADAKAKALTFATRMP